MIRKKSISFKRLSIVLLVLVVLGIVVAGIITASIFLYDMCGSRELPAIISPDGKYSVNVSDMTCPTTPFSGEVYINKLKNRSIIPFLNRKYVFNYRGVVHNVDVTWLDSNTLKIVYRNCKRISKQNTKWNEINIVYDNQCQNED